MKRGFDYIGVGVGAILVDGEGRLFLSRRGPLAKNERGLWEFPGGSVEFGEKLADALAREMREEYGIEIAVGELLDVVDHILPDEGQHWVSPTFDFPSCGVYNLGNCPATNFTNTCAPWHCPPGQVCVRRKCNTNWRECSHLTGSAIGMI